MIEIAIILVSLAFGSFANNVISFFVYGSKFDVLRSYCLCGEKKLDPAELIPVLSYFLQKGKCRSCGKRLSVRYPAVEIFSVLLALSYYMTLGPTLYFVLCYFSSLVLLITGIVDLHRFIIPNVMVTALLVLSILRLIFLSRDDLLTNITVSLSVALAFILVNKLFLILKKTEAIGYGDVKLLCVLALLFGAGDFFLGLWISSIIAVTRFYFVKYFFQMFQQESRIPFGFFLGIGFIIISFSGKYLISFYINLLQ